MCAIKNRDAQGRFVLTIRELLGTWAENAARFTVGETVVGIVRSVEEYGTFVEIAPNLAGLAESRGGRIATASVRTGFAMTLLFHVIPRKPSKRRLWRMKRGGFEEVSRFSRHNVAGNRLTRR